MRKKIFKIGFKVLLGVLTIAMFVTLPKFSADVSGNFSFISGVFVGSKSKYQGVIEVWNIDTFESGSAPKSNYLSKVAGIFQKENRGLYVLIRNLTEFECLNLLSSGLSPDIFSCSYAVASELRDYVVPFSSSENIDVSDNILASGVVDDSLYALPWCMGVYCLISTASHLSKAKFDITQDFSLADIALSVGYEIKSKNSTKIISSLTYGSQKYLLPKQALNSYNNKGLITTSSYSLDKNVNSQTPYGAYSKFLAGDSVILLGTQRDICRMENRVSQGKASDVFYKPLTTFTDLIQFTLISRTDDEIKRNLCEDFCKKLVEKSSQKFLKDIAMLPVTGQTDIYSGGIMSDIIPEISGISQLKNIFISKSEIAALQ